MDTAQWMTHLSILKVHKLRDVCSILDELSEIVDEETNKEFGCVCQAADSILELKERIEELEEKSERYFEMLQNAEQQIPNFREVFPDFSPLVKVGVKK